jgi:hypothetical protein
VSLEPSEIFLPCTTQENLQLIITFTGNNNTQSFIPIAGVEVETVVKGYHDGPSCCKCGPFLQLNAFALDQALKRVTFVTIHSLPQR